MPHEYKPTVPAGLSDDEFRQALIDQQGLSLQQQDWQDRQRGLGQELSQKAQQLQQPHGVFGDFSAVQARYRADKAEKMRIGAEAEAAERLAAVGMQLQAKKEQERLERRATEARQGLTCDSSGCDRAIERGCRYCPMHTAQHEARQRDEDRLRGEQARLAEAASGSLARRFAKRRQLRFRRRAGRVLSFISSMPLLAISWPYRAFKRLLAYLRVQNTIERPAVPVTFCRKCQGRVLGGFVKHRCVR